MNDVVYVCFRCSSMPILNLISTLLQFRILIFLQNRLLSPKNLFEMIYRKHQAIGPQEPSSENDLSTTKDSNKKITIL